MTSTSTVTAGIGTISAGARVEDLGPANDTMFCLMSGLQVGSLLYIGSRNVAPAMVIVYDLEQRRVVGRHDLGSGKFVQALAVSPDQATVYAGIVHATPGDTNLYAIPTGASSTPGKALAPLGDVFVRGLAVAPDGVVYAVGKEEVPGLWSHDPRTGESRRVVTLDPNATGARSVAATATTVYAGTGSELAGAGASRCDLFAVDRASGTKRSIRPDAIVGDVSIRDLLVVDDVLLVGSSGLGSSSRLAILPLNEEERATRTSVIELGGSSVGCFHAGPDGVYLSSDAVYRYDRTRGRLELYSSVDASERWALGHWDGYLVVVSASGEVVHIDPDTGVSDHVELIGAGAPAMPQLGMSLAVGADACYVGGNGVVVEHSLTEPGTVRGLRLPGEAKHMQVVGADLLMAVYNSQGLWRASPGAEPYRVARIPDEQNRPQDTAWDDVSGLFLAGGENDKQGGGFFCAWSPAERRLHLHINPLGQYQMVRSVCAHDGIAYVGGWNRYPHDPPGEVAALDPVSGAQLWRTDPALGSGISCLAARDDALVGVTVKGTLFAMDRSTGALRGSRSVTELVPGLSRMVAQDGVVYAGSDDAVFTVSPELEIELIASGLDGQWYSGPALAIDPAGRLYTLAERHLVRIVKEANA